MKPGSAAAGRAAVPTPSPGRRRRRPARRSARARTASLGPRPAGDERVPNRPAETAADHRRRRLAAHRRLGRSTTTATYIVDRLKELIKYKGYQVAPAELEALLMSHPLDRRRRGDPGARRGGRRGPQGVRGAKPRLVGPGVMAYVAERVAPYKKVRAVEFIDQIPKSLRARSCGACSWTATDRPRPACRASRQAGSPPGSGQARRLTEGHPPVRWGYRRQPGSPIGIQQATKPSDESLPWCGRSSQGQPGHSLGHSPCHNTAGQERTQQTTPLT